MKNRVKLARILKIKSVSGFRIYCIFNTGETRVVDFQKLFREWKVKPNDPEYLLRNEEEFKKVSLRNQTLSWKNIETELLGMDGTLSLHPYELSPDILYEKSEPIPEQPNRFYFGLKIKKMRLEKGLSQQQLADKSGTSKTYISRIENDQIEPELSTLYKIVEIGLGRKITVSIN